MYCFEDDRPLTTHVTKALAREPIPPHARAVARRLTSRWGERSDPYYWLRDDERNDPAVLAHLHAENAYTEHVLAPLEPLTKQLYSEMLDRLHQQDESVPVRHRGYWYVRRYRVGEEYPLYVRYPEGGSQHEEVLLDCNELAAGQAFFELGAYEVSPDNRWLAYTVDRVGRRQYELLIKDLQTGTLLSDRLSNIDAGVAWADDGATLLYVAQDPVTLLGTQVRSHRLGAAVSTDRLLYAEADDSFDLMVARSKSDRFVYICAESTTTSEWHYAATGEELRFQVFQPRQAGHEYQIEHVGEDFVIRTNWQAENFRLMSVPVAQSCQREHWRDLLGHQPQVLIYDFDVFRDFLAVSERADGLLRIRILGRDGRVTLRCLQADDPTYAMYLGSNPELDTPRLRYLYSSLTTPNTTFEFDVGSGERTLLKRQSVLGDFDARRYASELLWVPVRDGERVPVSLVYRRDLHRADGPLYLYAYGSYGVCVDPTFSSNRLALLDRGFVCAIAHVRGGQELGRRWYEAGRLLHKHNTFNDFLDVTDYLVAHGYAARERVFAAGASAGGLLMGVVLNRAPEKYAGVVVNVPFVDVVTTMLDPTIPLTTLEYEEWGNPAEQRYYEYMLGYSPYDNVQPQDYPPLLITTGYWDSQVQYFEPAKWVAKLRSCKTDRNHVLLHVNLDAGHGGKSGRYEHLHELAREYAFIIDIDGQQRCGRRRELP
jgi:oligopeptidase B